MTYHPRGGLAIDRASVRRVDVDGRLHVAPIPITAAQVNEYRGEEIPGGRELGLAPDRSYRLLRDPEELRRAVPTFNNIPLLATHQPVDAVNYAPSLVVGAIGSEAAFDGENLTNSLVVWAAPAIRDIERGVKKSLSAAYRYVPVLEGGSYKGRRYDLRMTKIVANHVALVESPRVDGMVIGDGAPRLNEIFAAARRRMSDEQYCQFALDAAMGRSPWLQRPWREGLRALARRRR